MESCQNSDFTLPRFLDRSEKLISTARKLSKTDLMEFMDISESLAELNFQRFRQWKTPFTPENSKQAIFAFTGDVYDGLDVNSLKDAELKYTQDHVRILSGLYGLLKPLDLIQPYRLEMGRPLETRGAKNLYEFWKETITTELNRTGEETLVNLASNEYLKAVDKRKLSLKIISPEFKDKKNGAYKIISFFAKKARGSMARYIIQNRITDEEGLHGFNADGYTFNPQLSKPGNPVFTRDER